MPKTFAKTGGKIVLEHTRRTRVKETHEDIEQEKFDAFLSENYSDGNSPFDEKESVSPTPIDIDTTPTTNALFSVLEDEIASVSEEEAV